jgi:molybdate transport system regulatory protein
LNAPRLVLRIELATGRLGHGKVELLEQIRDGQSLAAAARAMGMSYKRAWDLLATLNDMFDAPVTVSHPGRTKAGATTLTPFGEQLIETYRRIERQAVRSARRELDALADASRQGAARAAADEPSQPAAVDPRASASRARSRPPTSAMPAAAPRASGSATKRSA